jgi:regulator of sigma E protease
MTSIIYSIAGFIVAIGILVAVHEFGHFWVARKLGIKVLRFSIGFGKAIWSRTAADGTVYAVAAIPLGGYVKMLDEGEGEVAVEEQHLAFNRQPLWKRTLVVLAGPMFNFFFAIFAYAMVNLSGVEGITPVVDKVVDGSVAEQAGFKKGDVLLSIDGRKLDNWQDQRLYLFSKALGRSTVVYDVETGAGERLTRSLDLSKVPMDRIDAGLVAGGIGLIGWYPNIEPVIGRVVAGAPAEKAGVRAGDLITAIDGKPVDSWGEVVSMISSRPQQQVTLDVKRDGRVDTLVVVPDMVTSGEQKIGRIGVEVQAIEVPQERITNVSYGVFESLYRGTETTWMMSVLTLRMLMKMVTLEVSSKNISGPLTIAHFAGKSAQIGVTSFILFLAIVSVSLGVLNLLPIPILDGGHLLYYLAEAVTGNPVSEKVMIWGQQVGILMLFLLMSLAVYNDLGRLLN